MNYYYYHATQWPTHCRIHLALSPKKNRVLSYIYSDRSMASMSATAEKLRSKHIRTLEALNKLVEENKRLKQQLEQNNDVNTGGSGPESTESIQIERLQFENSRLASQLSDVNNTLLELRRSHAKSEQQFHDNKVGFLRQINELKTMLAQAEGKSKEYRHTIVDLEGQLEQQGSSRRGQLLSIEEQLRAAENALGQEKALVLELQEEIKGLLKTSGAADDEANLYKSKYIEIVKKDKLKAEEIRELKLQLEKLKKQSEVKRDGSADGLNEKIKSLGEQLQKSKFREAELKNDVQNRQKAEADLQEMVAKLEATIKELKNQYSNLSNELENEKKKHNANKQRPGENEETLGNKFGPFIKLKRENAILKAQIKDLMITQKKMLGGARRVNMSHGGRR